MRGVEVMFLGSGDAFGSGGRFQTCILVKSLNSKFLIDCGPSSLVAMKRGGVRPADIQQILITHLHDDHFGGLPFFILDAQFSKRETPLLIAGPPETKARVGEAMEVFFPKSSEIKQKFALEYLELSPGCQTAVGPMYVTPVEVVHYCGAPPYALRVEIEGRTIVYSGDTEWTEALVELAQGADLFICESYFYEKKVKFHLDYKSIETHRNELGCKRLVLTHMSDDMLARLNEIDVDCAEDGLCCMNTRKPNLFKDLAFLVIFRKCLKTQAF
jgi:ribonuclease BN (tRNA processing enzyme)